MPSICDACLSQPGCRRYRSNMLHNTVVTNCKPPSFRWNGTPVEGLQCRYELRKGKKQEKN
ncbi:MAG: hypothetical protein PHH85_02290 [Candidatus Methanoperedens sp.]|nr:hypothetical protein [Candidatus Methanoperedens sp.]